MSARRSLVAGLTVFALVGPALVPLGHDHGLSDRALRELACQIEHTAGETAAARLAAGREGTHLGPAAPAHHHRCEACRRDGQRRFGLGEPQRAAPRPVAVAALPQADEPLRRTLLPSSRAPRGPPSA